MARVVIHIGTHKTGTTILQDRLARSRAWLDAQGVIYPDYGNPAHHRLLAHWVGLQAPEFRSADPEQDWRQLARDHAHSDRTILLSSEEFSRASPNRPDFRLIRDWLSGFDSVRLVCFLRDQLTFMQSIYTEVSKAQNPPPLAEVVDHAIRSGKFTGVAVDYNILLDILERQLPPGDISFCNYHDACAAPGGLWGYFLRLIGVTAPPPGNLPDERHNESRPPVAVWAANRIAAPDRAPAHLVQSVCGVLERHVPDYARIALFTPDEIARLRDRLEPANARFRDRVLRHNPGFRMPALDGFDGRATRADIDPALFAALAAAP